MTESHHLPALIPCHLWSAQHVFFFHSPLSTITQSFIPFSFISSSSPSPSIHIKIYIHHSFSHMRFFPPHHMPIPRQSIPFQLFCNWRNFQTSSNILIPYFIHNSCHTTHPPQHSHLHYMQSERKLR